jgi:hypothetical protein
MYSARKKGQMRESEQYLIVTNNPQIRGIRLKKNFEIFFMPGKVQEVLSHCSRLLLEDDMMLAADIMGGRRARAFPCLTVFLRKKTGNENNGDDWLRIIDYQMLDEGRRELYLAYDEALNEDFRVLDRSLSETVIKSLNGLEQP